MNRHQDILELRAAGKSTRQIAVELGCTAHYVSQVLRTYGVHQRLAVKPARNDQIVRLHRAGWTSTQIAERLGITRNQACGVIFRHGDQLPPPRMPDHLRRAAERLAPFCAVARNAIEGEAA